MKVKELIEELSKCDSEAKVIVDNFDNEISLSWSGGDGCSSNDCDFVVINIKSDNTENYL